MVKLISEQINYQDIMGALLDMGFRLHEYDLYDDTYEIYTKKYSNGYIVEIDRDSFVFDVIDKNGESLDLNDLPIKSINSASDIIYLNNFVKNLNQFTYKQESVLKKRNSSILNEDRMIKFNGQLSPKFGWCVIMSGGAGSGKGYVQKQIMDFDAKVLDVDELKKLYVKAIKSDKTTLGRNKDITKRDYNFKNPEDVEKLHYATKKYGEEERELVFSGVTATDLRRLTNITFDITGKKPIETIDICERMKSLGYKICYVWVLTNRQEAMVRNLMRDRVVPDNIFHDIHNAVNDAVPKFLQSSDANLIDEAWLVFSSLGHAGGDSDELKKLAATRAIKLDKTSSGFKISNKLMHRIISTLGDPEVMTSYSDANGNTYRAPDVEKRRYMSQRDVLKRFDDLGIHPDEEGKYHYSAKRPDRYGGLMIDDE
jgi:dephospho-CoA kinase